MKIWLSLLILMLVLSISMVQSKADTLAEHFMVRVHINKDKNTTYSIHSANDFSALTYVEAEMRLNNFVPDFENIIVEKTGLDFSRVPIIQFEIVGTKGERTVPLHTIDSRLGIQAIQHAIDKSSSDTLAGIGIVREIRMTDEFLFAENHPSTCREIF